jgi:hypothetical protein
MTTTTMTMKRKSEIVAAIMLLTVSGLMAFHTISAHGQVQTTTTNPNATTPLTQPTQPTEPTIIVNTPPAPAAPAASSTPSVSWDTLAGAIIAILAALAAYLQARSTGKDKTIVELAKDKELHKEAIIDLARLGAEAYQLNADGHVTTEEYNAFMEIKVKPLVMKWGNKFGVADQIQIIIDAFEPPAPTQPSVPAMVAADSSSNANANANASSQENVQEKPS